MLLFEVGRLYSRLSDIHGVYGGSKQNGISPSANHPLIFLFTGQSGEQYGYQDRWADGVFLYTGEGQTGDMKFIRGNKAVRDHATNGCDLHLFQALGKSKPVRYQGHFVCTGWHLGHGPDREGNSRQIIIFHLINADDLNLQTVNRRSDQESGSLLDDLQTLRQRALAAASSAPQENPKDGRRNLYRRSNDVRAYIMARAKERCEVCGCGAPFKRRDGSGYLEPHHLRRLSDGGPDHPRWVAAVCPNCHREIHFGVNGKVLNDQLADAIGELEGPSKQKSPLTLA